MNQEIIKFSTNELHNPVKKSQERNPDENSSNNEKM